MSDERIGGMAPPARKTMVWIYGLSIIVSLAVMARALSLWQEGAMLPSVLSDALQFVGVFSIIVATISLIALSTS